MCSGSEAGSYLRLINFVYHSTLGLRVITKKRRRVDTETVRTEAVRTESSTGPPRGGKPLRFQSQQPV